VVMSILDTIIAEIKSWFEPDATPQEKNAYLDQKAYGQQPPLKWRTSVVDLLTLTGQPSDLESRSDLWREMGGQSHYTGSAEQNDWLHGRLMYELKIK
jgi:hypothetical protein